MCYPGYLFLLCSVSAIVYNVGILIMKIINNFLTQESKKAEIEAEIVLTETNARRRSLGNIRFEYLLFIT